MGLSELCADISKWYRRKTSFPQDLDEHAQYWMNSITCKVTRSSRYRENRLRIKKNLAWYLHDLKQKNIKKMDVIIKEIPFFKGWFGFFQMGMEYELILKSEIGELSVKYGIGNWQLDEITYHQSLWKAAETAGDLKYIGFETTVMGKSIKETYDMARKLAREGPIWHT